MESSTSKEACLPDTNQDTLFMSEAYRNLKKAIERASFLNDTLGEACLEAPQPGRLIRELRRQVETTDSLMLSCGVAASCSECAKATGSCCFREMGESYGVIELFANRLLGVELPQNDDVPGSCYFVGEKGCRLKFRHSFCLNYFCPGLLDRLGEKTVLAIQRQIGEQLLAGWQLELALAKHVNWGTIPGHL
ncbi:MAG: hypothetical protein ACP5IL_04765 [Syntrophobacteraceae bacterium]